MVEAARSQRYTRPFPSSDTRWLSNARRSYDREDDKTGLVFDEVVATDCVSYIEDLANRQISVNLTVAGDVVCYFGSLKGLFSNVHSVLSEKGIFVFTAEECSSEDSNFMLSKDTVGSYTIRSIFQL